MQVPLGEVVGDLQAKKPRGAGHYRFAPYGRLSFGQVDLAD
jgi:hypothetical protein